ncbi:glutaredoxin family protein [Corynebacterium flavescens]|uniref:glutaredoxin family protein n=1 Tax=Corynebacterium flavescens TaxID=28028 RepID=UPI000EC613D5|nr:thioredoxin family protein [Corynebacterium flavescens]
MARRIVELMVRTGCGSCSRVYEQILPVVEAAGATLRVRNVEEEKELNMEYGDRVPVVVIDGEEFACWEVENAELAAELAR